MDSARATFRRCLVAKVQARARLSADMRNLSFEKFGND
jgi:hypothetical protein